MIKKIYYTGASRRFEIEVKNAGYDINHHVFFSNPEALKGLASPVKIVDLGPPEISQRIIEEVKMLGIQVIIYREV